METWGEVFVRGVFGVARGRATDGVDWALFAYPRGRAFLGLRVLVKGVD